jgi:hypothetical protein
LANAKRALEAQFFLNATRLLYYEHRAFVQGKDSCLPIANALPAMVKVFRKDILQLVFHGLAHCHH